MIRLRNELFTNSTCLSIHFLLRCVPSQDDKKLEEDSVNKRRRKGNHYLTEVCLTGSQWKKMHSSIYCRIMFDISAPSLSLAWPQLSCHSAAPGGEDGELRENKVRSMATQLLAKFEENSSTAHMRSKVRRAVWRQECDTHKTVDLSSLWCWFYFFRGPNNDLFWSSKPRRVSFAYSELLWRQKVLLIENEKTWWKLLSPVIRL